MFDSCPLHNCLPYLGTKISARRVVIIAAAICCVSDFISQCELWNLHILLDPTLSSAPAQEDKVGASYRLNI